MYTGPGGRGKPGPLRRRLSALTPGREAWDRPPDDFAYGTAAWSVLLVLAMTAFAGWAAARQAGRQEVLAGI